MNDASPPSSSPYSYSNPGTPKSPSGVLNVSRPTGLKLVLPPLKAGKPIKGIKRSAVGYGPSFVREPEVKKAPRPVKLKPLREVLTRLVNLIKKCVFSSLFRCVIWEGLIIGLGVQEG